MLRYLAKGITGTPAIAAIEDLADGERVDVPGVPRVIHVPGHTAGSCALLLEDRRLLFTATRSSLWISHAARAGSQGRRSFADRTQTMRRGRWSRSTCSPPQKARVVLPGHGDPWTHGVESAVEHARRT
jgi:glyoxylase-like metal-dependent hydrolase (beta-lactamase superfamily II)